MDQGRSHDGDWNITVAARRAVAPDRRGRVDPTRA